MSVIWNAKRLCKPGKHAFVHGRGGVKVCRRCGQTTIADLDEHCRSVTSVMEDFERDMTRERHPSAARR